MTAPVTDRAGVLRVMMEPVKCLTPIGAEAILAALEAAGLRVVPVEMTEAMFRIVLAAGGAKSAMYARAAWPDLLAASPFAPPKEDQT